MQFIRRFVIFLIIHNETVGKLVETIEECDILSFTHISSNERDILRDSDDLKKNPSVISPYLYIEVTKANIF